MDIGAPVDSPFDWLMNWTVTLPWPGGMRLASSCTCTFSSAAIFCFLFGGGMIVAILAAVLMLVVCPGVNSESS